MRVASFTVCLALATSGCGQTHGGSVAGIDPNRQLHTLDGTEWESMCGWMESLRGEQPLSYYCGPDGLPSQTDCFPTLPCYSRNWSTRSCLVVEAMYWPTRPDCSLTVRDYARCWERAAIVGCYRFPPLDECQEYLACL